jgi:CRP/FNR family cyclic AMP-dependent transcriptional regulator
MEARVDLIGSIPWLGRLSEEDRQQIAAGAREVTWEDREVVFREGDTGTTCYVLLDGQVRVQRAAPDGRRITIARLEPPAAFGELSLLGTAMRNATIEAHGPCRALELQADDVLPALQRDATAALGIAQVLAERLRVADDKLIGYALGTAAGGVAATLLAWVEARQSQGAGESDVEVVGGPIDVARSSGVSRHATERFLDHLEVEGVISVRRGRTIVHRPAALLEYLG